MFWLVLSIAAWGFVHSLTASLWFKDILRRWLGDGFMRFYRLAYNIFSVVSIVPILYLMVTLPDQGFYRIPGPWNIFMQIGQGLAAVLLLISLLQTDVLSFMGLRQLFDEVKSGKLVTGGFYRLVRHPLYFFGLLVLWLSPSVSLNSFVLYLAFTGYFLVGMFFEERKLRREFGREYAEYQAVTPMLIPGLKLPGNK
jgi:protein-S-isoprenylcysteine O-methyltransferase Ste14